jgi:hypothetical protein
MFLAAHVLSFVDGVIRPDLLTVALLLVVFPASFEHCTADVAVDAGALGSVIHPLALVGVTVGVDQATITRGHVVLPIALVVGAVTPQLFASAGAFAVFPLPLIDVFRVELYWAL